jgi:hypothetical protein
MRTIQLTAASTVLGTGLVLAGLGLGAAGAATVEPQLVEGNPSCADVAPGTTELKLDVAPMDGKYTDDVITVNILNSGPAQIDWASDLDVAAVLMKGGPVANAYLYPGAADLSDTALVTPTNPNNDDPYGISHVTFCYDESDPGDEPEIPEEEPEVPEEEPEVPEEAPEVPEEEPEVPEEEPEVPEVQPEAPEEQPEPEVLGATATPGGAELPRTGAGTLVLAGIGAGLTGLGEALRRLGRR